ncbi:TetR/AcrR family transcriptional regulator [Singulisphaera sp. PoT]|uniref:TetR/AcrR family transcriptional regulator n=1 Tax=Singulisphaera sp. PoT TaxID=3411797 RepID=UPI003BF5A5BB
MPDEAPRVRDPESTRAAIIDAAERLFAEKGFAATSTREISSGSGVSHALIHHHFGTKENLYAEVKRRLFEDYSRRAPIASGSANRPLSVKAEMKRLMTYLLENDLLFRLSAWMRLEGDSYRTPGQPNILEGLEGRIAASQRLGRIRTDLDAGALSVMVFGLIYFWVENRSTLSKRFAHPLDDNAYVRQAIAFAEQALAPNDGKTPRTRRTRPIKETPEQA